LIDKLSPRELSEQAEQLTSFMSYFEEIGILSGSSSGLMRGIVNDLRLKHKHPKDLFSSSLKMYFELASS